MSSVLSEFTRPEHTGENRCWPCTAVNVAVLALACLTLSFRSPTAAAVLAVVGVAVVWVRGYLIPYTPTFAPRLVERLPVDPFHRERYTDGGPEQVSDGGPTATERNREPGTLADATTDDGEEILQTLVGEGVIHATDEDVRLDDAFEARWESEMQSLRSLSPEDLAAAAESVAPGSAVAQVVTERGRTYVVVSDGSGDPGAESWLRRPVAIAETAAARALADAELDPWRRAVAAHALCIFLDRCPDCGVDLQERPAGGCCGPPKTDADGRPLQALVCPECRSQFAEFD